MDRARESPVALPGAQPGPSDTSQTNNSKIDLKPRPAFTWLVAAPQSTDSRKSGSRPIDTSLVKLLPRPARDLWKWIRAFRDWAPDKLSKLVLFALASRMRTDSLQAFPSHSTIARDCSLSRRQVIRVIEVLVAIGWLIKHQSRSKNGKRWPRNTYIASYPAGYDEDALQIDDADRENW